MPHYNFFEVKHDSHKKILFQEFNLTTANRSHSKKRSNSSEDNEQKFTALPMPNFEIKPKTCMKKSVCAMLGKQSPFKLSTDLRGLDKKQRFEQQIQQEKQLALE